MVNFASSYLYNYSSLHPLWTNPLLEEDPCRKTHYPWSSLTTIPKPSHCWVKGHIKIHFKRISHWFYPWVSTHFYRVIPWHPCSSIYLSNPSLSPMNHLSNTFILSFKPHLFFGFPRDNCSIILLYYHMISTFITIMNQLNFLYFGTKLKRSPMVFLGEMKINNICLNKGDIYRKDYLYSNVKGLVWNSLKN